MPLGHCFVKAGDALTAEDKAAIEKMVDSGMSQAEAVDSLMSDVDQQIDSITSQVEAQGGEVKRLEQAQAEGLHAPTIAIQRSSARPDLQECERVVAV